MQLHSNAVVTSNNKLKLIMLLSLVFININLKSEVLSPTIEFSVPLNISNGPNEPFTPMVHYNNNTYLVYVDNNFRPLVIQKSCNLTEVTVPLDPNPDYVAQADGHNRYSMGIDKNGYLHITGDMHFYPVEAQILPDRYKNQQILYWVSNAPYDITKGFTFAGGLNSSTAIPGQFWTTGHFFNDNKLELYYTSMIRGVYNAPIRLTGEMAVGLYKYDALNHKWIALGAPPAVDPTYPAGTQYFTSLFWDKAGFGSQAGQGQWFNNYFPAFYFDNQNVLHFSVSINVDPSIPGESRVIYAKSFDGGLTWYKANGKTKVSLPLGGFVTDGSRLADIVADFGTSLIGVNTNVVADNTGQPAVNIQTPNGSLVWYRYNGTTWTSDINFQNKFWGYSGFLSKDGKITTNYYDAVRRSTSFTSASSAYSLYSYLPSSQLSSFICISDIGVKTSGDIYGIGLSTNLNTINVIKLNFTPQGLPCDWSSSDIGTNIQLGGSSDYLNGTFTLRSAGSGLYPGNTDSFTFTSRTLVGDGTIIAHVASQNQLANINGSSTGLIMRQSLSNNTVSAYIGISLNGYAQFICRNAINASSVGMASAAKGPIWLKLVRSGNAFSSYTSLDGINWTQVGTTQTIVMNNTIYVGLASYSANTPDMFTSTVDNVHVISGASYVTPTLEHLYLGS
ncbi:MAG: BNR-4 repeat-containing protein [Candidatus Babeliales bacterium]|nr:BNR-4 repeat-containing protein [Candidatus Babeliales bacterium]